MNRILTAFNFLGVVALVVLSVLQWRTNGELTQTADRLEQIRLEQSTKIADQDKSIKSLTAEVDDFRQKSTKCEGALKESEGKVTAAAAERPRLVAQRDQLIGQRDQLSAEIEKWKSAVSDRDQALKQAGDALKLDNDQIQRLSAERNDAVSKYNQAVKDLNSKSR